MVVTSESGAAAPTSGGGSPRNPEAHAASEAHAAPRAGAGLPSADEAAARVGRLFPEIYRRYHFGRRLAGDASLPVTRRGLEVLRHLSVGGPLTVGEQAAHLGLRRNSVSELLQRLEAKGLVARIRDERDERRVLVWLTEAGREVVARIGEVLAPDLIAQRMAALSPRDRATVVRGFELLVAGEPPPAPHAHLRPPAQRDPTPSSRDPTPSPRHRFAIPSPSPRPGRPRERSDR